MLLVLILRERVGAKLNSCASSVKVGSEGLTMVGRAETVQQTIKKKRQQNLSEEPVECGSGIAWVSGGQWVTVLNLFAFDMPCNSVLPAVWNHNGFIISYHIICIFCSIDTLL